MKQRNLHCPEVERLMSGKLPFVTLHGITIVIIIIILACVCLWCTGGKAWQITSDMIAHVLERMSE
ncbi:MAG: hypothetical protein ACI3X9_01755 [Bacteroidaceae bacterium]